MTLLECHGRREKKEVVIREVVSNILRSVMIARSEDNLTVIFLLFLDIFDNN